MTGFRRSQQGKLGGVQACPDGSGRSGTERAFLFYSRQKLWTLFLVGHFHIHRRQFRFQVCDQVRDRLAMRGVPHDAQKASAPVKVVEQFGSFVLSITYRRLACSGRPVASSR